MMSKPIIGIELVNFLCTNGYVARVDNTSGLAELFPKGDEYFISTNSIQVAYEVEIGLKCLKHGLNKAGYTLDDFMEWRNA